MSTSVEIVRMEAGVARVVFRSENGVQILSRAVLDQLKAVLKELKGDKSLRVVVFQAEGRTFLAGADINELKELTRKSARRYAREGQRLFQRIAELPAVTIAAIHATCAGGGLELALACDLRLAGASARIGAPEVTLGFIPGWGGTVRSTLLFGAAVANRVILSGELLPAAEAERLGVVEALFPDAEFRAAVDARIAQYLKTAPTAVATAKQMIADVYAVELQDLLDMEAEQFAQCCATGEPREGTTAFLEKRPAAWAKLSAPSQGGAGGVG
ncbi:MAG: enoyl-CoA hydratase/isomerase family protein [Deltaproteobacteria bacterium]